MLFFAQVLVVKALNLANALHLALLFARQAASFCGDTPPPWWTGIVRAPLNSYENIYMCFHSWVPNMSFRRHPTQIQSHYVLSTTWSIIPVSK